MVNCNLSQLSLTITLIEIPVSSISVNNVSITVVTQDYQSIIANQSIIIETEYPTQSYQQSFGLNVWGTSLVTQLTMNSYKVNVKNSIELTIVPIVKNNSEIVVYLPTYLTSQIQNIQSTNTNIS